MVSQEPKKTFLGHNLLEDGVGWRGRSSVNIQEVRREKRRPGLQKKGGESGVGIDSRNTDVGEYSTMNIPQMVCDHFQMVICSKEPVLCLFRKVPGDSDRNTGDTGLLFQQAM